MGDRELHQGAQTEDSARTKSKKQELATLRDELKPYNVQVGHPPIEDSLVHVFKFGGSATAEFNEPARHYVNKIAIASKHPFVLKHLILPNGPIDGYEAILIKRGPTFPFTRLPVELRVKIYHLVIGNVKNIRVTKTTKRFLSVKSRVRTPFISPEFYGNKCLSLLGVSKQIQAEVLHEMYHGTTFYFIRAHIFTEFVAAFPSSARHIEAVGFYWMSKSWGAARKISSALKRCTSLVHVRVNLEIAQFSFWENSDAIYTGARILGEVLRQWLLLGRGKNKGVDSDHLKATEVGLFCYGAASHAIQMEKDEADSFKTLIQKMLCGGVLSEAESLALRDPKSKRRL